MFIRIIFITAKKWTQPKPPDKWLNKMWYMYIMGYYLPRKNNEVLMHTKTLMTLKA